MAASTPSGNKRSRIVTPQSESPKLESITTPGGRLLRRRQSAVNYNEAELFKLISDSDSVVTTPGGRQMRQRRDSVNYDDSLTSNRDLVQEWTPRKSARAAKKGSTPLKELGETELVTSTTTMTTLDLDVRDAEEGTPNKKERRQKGALPQSSSKVSSSTPSRKANGLMAHIKEEFEVEKEVKIKEEPFEGTPKTSRRLESLSESTTTSFSVSSSLKPCSVPLTKVSLQLPNTALASSEILVATEAELLSTPTRSSSRLQPSSSVVRRLESSLNEASPSTPTARTRLQREAKKVRPLYAEPYFNCGSSEDSDPNVDYSDSDSDTENDCDEASENEEEDMETDQQVPVRALNTTPLKTKSCLENPTLCLTPKVAQAISRISNKDFSPRRTPNINNVKNTPKSESYFTAEKRIKFGTPQSIRKAEEMKKVRESKTAKKPRKGNRQGIDKISAKKMPLAPPNFSVTKESVKIPLDTEFDAPWMVEHSDQIDELHSEIQMDFSRWWILLREGFNIMLHGYGSKQPMFDSFSKFLGEKYLVIAINGLFTKFNAKKFVLDFQESLDYEREFLLQTTSIQGMTEDLCLKVSKEKRHRPVFIYAMNFDVLAARHHQMLTAIAGLARIPFVHVIASSDHINAGLGIPPLENLQLNFSWVDCTTYIHYSNELAWNNNIFGSAGDANTTETSIEHIFKSLTTNAKKAFSILAGLQLQKLKGKKNKIKGFQGVEFRELLRICRDSFIAHSETTLKSLLTEFVDHKLVRYSGKSEDNFLIVDLEESILEKYAD